MLTPSPLENSPTGNWERLRKTSLKRLANMANWLLGSTRCENCGAVLPSASTRKSRLKAAWQVIETIIYTMALVGAIITLSTTILMLWLVIIGISHITRYSVHPIARLLRKFGAWWRRSTNYWERKYGRK